MSLQFHLITSLLLLLSTTFSWSQSQPYILATSQIGFRPQSPKILTLRAQQPELLPDSIAFYIHMAGYNLPRIQEKSGLWANSPYPYPYDVGKGKYGEIDPSMYYYIGWLTKSESRWGTIWQADFSDFQQEGLHQIETESAFSLPFSIEPDPYARLVRGYMTYLHAQRSGYEIPGVRPAEHLDDAQLDNGKGYHRAAGGWYNAGDLRKWMSLTQFNLQTLHDIYQYGHPIYREGVLDEIRWGNKYFHDMITEEGQVYEDVGGGNLRPGFEYADGWWTENHPGCIANNDGNFYTDNLPATGDERILRTSYNPFVQLAFVKHQALISTILPALEGNKSLHLAEKAWQYAQANPHDDRTMFVATELIAAIELLHASSPVVTAKDVERLTEKLLARQDRGTIGLSGYFLEKDVTDAYRSVAFSGLPISTLLRLLELNMLPKQTTAIQKAVELNIDNYLLADAKSNPYGVTPYGVFIKKPGAEYQLYRDAGRGRGVRTFIHPFNEQVMVHGSSSVVTDQAYLLAKAGALLDRPDWKQHAERLIHWSTGHNTEGLSLFFGIGHRFPVSYSTHNLNMPQRAIVGFIGRADDTPYIETSNAIMWNTQEVWDIPYQYAVSTALYLRQ